jgi:hypothetical protein
MATDREAQVPAVVADEAPAEESAALDPDALVFRFLGNEVSNYEHGLPAADITVATWDGLTLEQQERMVQSPLYEATDLAPVLPTMEPPVDEPPA